MTNIFTVLIGRFIICSEKFPWTKIHYQFDFRLVINLQEAKSDTLMVTVLQLASSKLWKLKSCITIEKFQNRFLCFPFFAYFLLELINNH